MLMANGILNVAHPICHNVTKLDERSWGVCAIKMCVSRLIMIMFCGLMKEFIHHCTWSWDEVERLLSHFKTLELL